MIPVNTRYKKMLWRTEEEEEDDDEGGGGGGGGDQNSRKVSDFTVVQTRVTVKKASRELSKPASEDFELKTLQFGHLSTGRRCCRSHLSQELREQEECDKRGTSSGLSWLPTDQKSSFPYYTYVPSTGQTGSKGGERERYSTVQEKLEDSGKS